MFHRKERDSREGTKNYEVVESKIDKEFKDKKNQE